jgi:hypothetical protein
VIFGRSRVIGRNPCPPSGGQRRSSAACAGTQVRQPRADVDDRCDRDSLVRRDASVKSVESPTTGGGQAFREPAMRSIQYAGVATAAGSMAVAVATVAIRLWATVGHMLPF